MPALFSNAYIALFIIIALGPIIGWIKTFGFSFDISAIIFATLLLGHFGMVVPDDFMKFGSLINAKSECSAAPIACATVYPVALVFVIIASQLLPKIL